MQGTRPRKCHDTMVTMTGTSGRGTARQTIRIDPERWGQFEKGAAAVGTDRSKVINDFIAWYNHEPGAKRPTRPPGDNAAT